MLPNDEIEVLLKQYEGIIRKIVNKYKVYSLNLKIYNKSI